VAVTSSQSSVQRPRPAIGRWLRVKATLGTNMKVLLTILIVTAALSGCARLHRAEVATQAQTEMIGMSKKDLYLCAGVPVRQAQIEGLEFLTYIGGGDSTGVGVGTSASPGLAVGAISNQRRYCEVTFVLDNGVIQKVNYQGRTGGWASSGEQCAFVVEKCVKR